MASICWASVSAGLQHAAYRRRDGDGGLVLEFPCGEPVVDVELTSFNCQLRVPLQFIPFTGWPFWMAVCNREWCLTQYAKFLGDSPSLRCSPKCQEELRQVEAKLQLVRFDPSLPGKMRASRLGLEALERSLTDPPDLYSVGASA